MNWKVTLYSSVDKDLQIDTFCLTSNYCYICCSEMTLLFKVYSTYKVVCAVSA